MQSYAEEIDFLFTRGRRSLNPLRDLAVITRALLSDATKAGILGTRWY